MVENPLLSIGPPWIFAADLDSNRFGKMADQLIVSGGKKIELEGARMTTLDALFDEFAQAAMLPDYFGRNWPALDECLADLEWLPASSYVMTLRNPARLLKSALRDRPVFIKIVTKVAAEWAEPVSVGEYWDRPAIPLHLVVDRACGADHGWRECASTPDASWLGTMRSI
ncbi:hypothetical protein Athai_67190 [Actinocatenispora thailandica]|uniref:Barstar (barnase inhibitor) domain-containing protein n=1 Tax=Actinocatenispora thailandica TaxID=227318 RepID=A0A7R7I126_9ACTN|nr:barstar family protein [Actinocatenispora thailandica]BCJ39216.1 hypothetical protein Athai_67190 [Actinocatenispora thailandica]